MNKICKHDVRLATFEANEVKETELDLVDGTYNGKALIGIWNEAKYGVCVCDKSLAQQRDEKVICLCDKEIAHKCPYYDPGESSTLPTIPVVEEIPVDQTQLSKKEPSELIREGFEKPEQATPEEFQEHVDDLKQKLEQKKNKKTTFNPLAYLFKKKEPAKKKEDKLLCEMPLGLDLGED